MQGVSGLIARVVDPSDVSRQDRDAHAGDDRSQKQSKNEREIEKWGKER